jgi:hypothetical protein
MNTRILAIACGTTLSIVGATLAQQEQPKSGQPVQERPKTPSGEIKTTQARVSSASTPSTTEPALLRDLVGVWRVDVLINADQWMHKGAGGGAHRDSNNTPATDPSVKPSNGTPSNVNPNDPSNPNRVKDPFKRTDETNTPSTQPPATDHDRDIKNRGGAISNDEQPAARIAAGGKTFTGYAENKMVLGNNILQQTIVVPEMLMSRDSARRDNVQGAPVGASDQMYRGMSFIAFDDSSNQYGIVFLDSRQGTIHCDKGTYDESARRLVFNGKEGSEMSAPKDEQHMGRHGNVRVVLEVLSPTQHRVTMYAADAQPGDWKNPNDIQLRNPATDRDRPAADKPAGDNDANQDVNKLNRENKRDDSGTGVKRDSTQPGIDRNNPSQPGNNLRSADWNSGTIIYQATYTKVSDANETSRYRRLLQEPGTPDLNSNDLNRNPNDPSRDRDRRDSTAPARPDNK